MTSKCDLFKPDSHLECNGDNCDCTCHLSGDGLIQEKKELEK